MLKLQFYINILVFELQDINDLGSIFLNLKSFAVLFGELKVVTLSGGIFLITQ